MKKIGLKGSVNVFSVDYNAIDITKIMQRLIIYNIL